VVIVAIVSHPRPSTIGSTALPLSPIDRNRRSLKIASRGMYPLSSRKPNIRKNVVTTGSTIAIAYVNPMVTRP
jgi:hypothetical protein